MTIFLGLFLLWMAGELSWLNAAILIATIVSLRSVRGLIFTKWVPVSKVEEEREAFEAALEERLKERLVEEMSDFEAVRRKLDWAENRIGAQDREILLLRTQLELLRQGKQSAQRKPPPRPATWWEILGVPRDATLETAETAYRTLARKYHPDRPDGDLGRMQAVNAAIGEARKSRKAS